VWEIAPAAANKDALLNGLVTTHAAVAAHPCIGGVPPTTTGALGATVSSMPPLILLEN
jgi:hypothetical protein